MHPVEAGLAFLEGLALIASPCILPVLPLVLSSSLEGGHKRPFGIITGFVLAFSAFALFSRWLVAALGLDLELIRKASLILLFLFGLVLLSDKLSVVFSRLTQGAADLGSKVSSGGKEGFLSGVLIGALIGLIWTPCAGPILAAVLVQVIRQQTDFAAVTMILAFAIGAGLPMLAIALTGRKLMGKLSFFTTHAEAVRKAMGVIILLSVAVIASGVSAQLPGSGGKTSLNPIGLADALPNPYPAPEITGVDGWINSKPLAIASLKGKVVLIDFWTYSCINCVRTLPFTTRLDKEYRDKGLVIIGVHAPEFEFEKKRENVEMAVDERGIHYPVALDSELATWSNFHNQYWPAQYLIDKDGAVVYTHFGEGAEDVTENNIRALLGLTGGVASEEAPHGAEVETPETYLGYARSERSGGEGNPVQNATADYHFPAFLQIDHWALSGKWDTSAQNITSSAAGAKLRINFMSRDVFLVMGTASGQPVLARVSLNGTHIKDIKVDHHTLYTLVHQKAAANGQLELIADGPGLEAYAFTFGS